MNRLAFERFKVILISVVVCLLLGLALWGCGALKRSGLIGGGAAVGAGAGTLMAGPVGGIGGAAIGAAVSSAVVEADTSSKRADSYAAVGRPYVPPPPETPWYLTPKGWAALGALYWAWLRRAHLMDLATGKAPRLNAILCAIGIRTHKTSILDGAATVSRRRAGA